MQVKKDRLNYIRDGLGQKHLEYISVTIWIKRHKTKPTQDIK